MRLLGLNEVRRTADSRQGESGAKPEGGSKAWPPEGRIQWVETECLEAQGAREPRIPVRVHKGAGQETESS